MSRKTVVETGEVNESCDEKETVLVNESHRLNEVTDAIEQIIKIAVKAYTKLPPDMPEDRAMLLICTLGRIAVIADTAIERVKKKEVETSQTNES